MWKPDYATVEELRDYAGITDDDDTTDNAKLQRNITAASRAVNKHCRRQFGKVDAPETRTYTASGYAVDIDDLMDLTAVVVETADGDVGLKPATVSRWLPQNAAADGVPYTRLYLTGSVSSAPAGISITGLWGWAAVPDSVKEATLLQALRFSLRKNSPFGVAGSPDLGSELRLLAKVDPDVAVMLRDYVRRGKVG